MKRLLLGTVLSTALLLSACGGETEKEEMKAEETEVENEKAEAPAETEKAEKAAEEITEEEELSEGVKQLEDGTYEIEMAKVEITGTEILPPDEYDEAGKERLLVTYEVTSKVTPEEVGEVEVTPWSVWMATIEATQENETSIVKLNHGFTPEEYFSYQDTEMNVIKKDATVENVAIYELDNRESPVVLNATQGIAGEDLGSIVIDVSE